MSTRSEVIRAKRRAIGGKRLRCKKGKSCSAACINRNKYCLVDAPTPVAGALPRAVRAIQSRKERVGPREKRKALQKRREYIKKRVKDGNKLRDSRQKYLSARKKLQEDLYKSILNGYGKDKIKKKLERLHSMVGSKLGVPRTKPMTESDEDKLLRRYYRYRDTLSKLFSDARKEAVNGRLQAYNKAEEKIMFMAKAGGLFWEHFIKDSGYNRGKGYEKGEVWRQTANVRSDNRSKSIKNIHRELISSAKEAVKNGDKREYNRLEKAILKIQSKTKGVSLEEVKKGQIWMEGVKPLISKKLAGMLLTSIEVGDKDKYSKVEEKILQSKSKIEIGKFLNKELVELARSGNRKGYDQVERTLVKAGIMNSFSRGNIWKEIRLNSAAEGLIARIDKAKESNDKKSFDRLVEKLNKMYEKSYSYITNPEVLGLLRSGFSWESPVKEAGAGGFDGKLFNNLLSRTRGYYSSEVRGYHRYLGYLLGKYSKSFMSYDSEEDRIKFNRLSKEFLSKLKEEGIDAQGAYRTIAKFTGTMYRAYRQAQMGLLRGGDASRLKREAENLERMFSRPEVKKPEIEKFRGKRVDDNTLRGMIESAKSGGSFSGRALSSWSTELFTAKNFADAEVDWGNNRVIYVTINKQGVPLNKISSVPGEYEVLTPSSANYKYLGYNKIDYYGQIYHVFNVEES